LKEGDHDLLVLGEALPVNGEAPALGSFVQGLLAQIPDAPVLIVRTAPVRPAREGQTS